MIMKGNMKKYIILLTLLFSLIFNQTGVVTPKGEHAMGVWGYISQGVDCGEENCEEIYGGAMSYMMGNGLELGVDYSTFEKEENDTENITFYFQYHLKNIGENLNSSFDLIPNFAFGLGKLTTSVSDDSAYNDDTDFTLIGCTLYGKNLFSFKYLYKNPDDSNSKNDERISFSKIFNLNSFYLMGEYSIDIEDGKFSDLHEDLDDGILSIGIGVTF